MLQFQMTLKTSSDIAKFSTTPASRDLTATTELLVCVGLVQYRAVVCSWYCLASF